MTQPLNPAEILTQYTEGAHPPRLSPVEQSRVQAYMAELGMVPVYGVHSWDEGEPTPTDVLLSHDSESGKYLAMPGAVIGPCMLGDQYYRDGVSVWIPAQAR